MTAPAKPTLYQTAQAMLALAREQQPGRCIRVDLGVVTEQEMAGLAADSGTSTEVQLSGLRIGGVLESVYAHSELGTITALCIRPARPGDEERMRR